MTDISVLGAGVVGSSYGALLARAGHDVRVVARGARAEQLQESGLRVHLDDDRVQVRPDVAIHLDRAPCDVLVVAVRGDQLRQVLDDVAACNADLVLVFTNPLELREEAETRIGAGRVVWCFSGIGGEVVDGTVVAHRVREQPTVVQMGAPRSSQAVDLLTSVDARLRRVPDMVGWLDTHAVFIAATAAVILHEDTASMRACPRSARHLVTAMREGFAELEARGTVVTPGNLRAIFGRVPVPIAAAYWAIQLSRPMVTVSMAPHVRATRDTEQRAVARHALALVDPSAAHYRRVVQPLACS